MYGKIFRSGDNYYIYYIYLCPAHRKVINPLEARKIHIVSPFRNTPDTILYVWVTHVHTN